MQLHYAAFLPRVCAYIVDGIMFYAMTLVLDKLAIVDLVALQQADMITNLVWLHVGGYAVTLGYYLFFLLRHGATPGKIVFNIKVVMTDGSAVTWLAVLLRYGIVTLVTSTISLSIALHLVYPVLYYVCILMMMVLVVWMLTSIYQCIARVDRRVIHDFIAGTVVVSARPPKNGPRLPKTWTTSSSSF